MVCGGGCLPCVPRGSRASGGSARLNASDRATPAGAFDKIPATQPEASPHPKPIWSGNRSKENTDMTREYLEDKIAKARAAIAFAVPGADISYARATLAFAEAKLAALK